MKRPATICLCYLAMTMATSSVLAGGGHSGGGHSGGGHNHNGGGGGGQTRAQGGNTNGGNAVQHNNRAQNNSSMQGHTSHQHGTTQVQHRAPVQNKSQVQTNKPQMQNRPAQNAQKVDLHKNVQVHNQDNHVGHGHNNQGMNNHVGHQNNNSKIGTALGHNGKNHQHPGSNMSPVKLHHNNSNGISHHHFNGNKVVLGKHHVNLSSAGYKPSFYKHGDHYHGHWNWNQASNHHNQNPGWNNNWGQGHYHHGHNYQPYFWGVGGWGLGSMIYTSGYLGYQNPYYYNSGATGYCYNYAQPIPVSYDTVLADSGTNSTAPSNSNAMDAALLAFQQNDFPTALDLVNQEIQKSPDDAVLHELRGLVLFAKGDYQQAAATVHSVLAVGPGWDWETLSGMYPDVSTYTTQLRTLEAYTKQNPQDAAGHFLLAYHYMSDGYPDAATKQLQLVKQIIPNDMVATNLLKMTTTTQPATPTDNASAASPTLANVEPSQPAVATPTAPEPAPVDPSTIVGSWTASRDDGSNFGLTLKDDKTFSWSYSPKNQKPQSFNGTYTVEGNMIALERKEGGSLLAEIAASDRSKFNFKMLGAPEEDPGLIFIR